MVRLFVFFLFLLLPIACAERVCGVYDGDTLTTCEGVKVRLWGIDAPEKRQPLGLNSRDYLRRLTHNRDIELECVGRSYNRQVCRVFVLTGRRRIDAQRELVGHGLAYDSFRYSGGEYAEAEAFARKLERGVWSLLDGGVRPWVWRHR